MDGSGLSWAFRRARLPWLQIEACAFRSDNGRRILRIFRRARTKRTLAIGDPQDVAGSFLTRSFASLTTKLRIPDYFDIDFNVAENPEQSLEKAFRACAAWIAATPDPSVTDSPVREFVELQSALTAPPEAPRRAVAGRRVLFMFLTTGLAAVFVVAAFSNRMPLLEEPLRAVDERPGLSVLFLGNSRIFVNDLPKMVRDVADSAHSPVRYDVHMRAWGAATLKEHWNDEGDRDALQKPWGMVILQTQSGTFGDAASTRDFAEYGEKLIRAAEAGGSPVALMANWTLGPNFFDGDAAASQRYGDRIEQGTRALAEPTGAGVIDLERAFEDAAASAPELALTSDGNHPTHAGSFLAALVIYGYLSHADVSNVSWRPYDMSKATATQLKDIAARYLR